LLGEDWVRDWVRVKVAAKTKAHKRFSLHALAGDISGVVAGMVQRASKEAPAVPPAQPGRTYVNGETFSAGRQKSDEERLGAQVERSTHERREVEAELSESKILI
jgi:hypothetical protein